MANLQAIDTVMHSKQPDHQNNKDVSDESESGRRSIQNLQFVHTGPFINNEIQEYFQQFGEIKFIQFTSENGNHYGSARIEVDDHGKAVLSKASHCIANCMVNVGEANIPDDRLLSLLNPLSVPPDQDAAKNILILNDDCLRNALERLNLADVCVRFNQQAKEVFRSKYKDISKDTVDFYRLKKSDTEIVLCNFGSLVESLGIDPSLLKFWPYDEENEVVYWIAKHCCNVKKLTISNVKLNQTFEPLQPLFAKLEHFFMEKCEEYCDRKTIQDMEETMVHLLSVCDNLKTLHLEGDAKYSYACKMKCIGRKFPLLQEADIVGYCGIEDDTLKSMITQNPTLKKLTIKSGNSNRSTEVFRCIGKHLINLIELEFDEGFFISGIKDLQNDIQCLSSLRSLKVLKLKFAWLSVSPLMESLAANEIPIEHLDFRHGLVDSAAIKAISKLKQIKILELSNTRNMTDDYLIELAKELPHLSELHLTNILLYPSYRNYHNNVSTIGIAKAISHANRLSLLKLHSINGIKIEVRDYNAILKSVLNRPESTKLVIEIENKDIDVDVSEEILHQNRDWLKINLYPSKSKQIKNMEKEKMLREKLERVRCTSDHDTDSSDSSDFWDLSDASDTDRYNDSDTDSQKYRCFKKNMVVLERPDVR